jgi:hypothetical protein
MMGSLAPLGMPLSTEVVSGERAEDGLDLPIIQRMRNGLQTTGLLVVSVAYVAAGPLLTPGTQGVVQLANIDQHGS